MRISSVARILIRNGNGQTIWKEMTENQLPKGGTKLSFRNNALIAFAFGFGLFSYAYFQSEINPDSKWAKVYRQITEEPLGWIPDSKKNVPISPDHRPPVV